MFEYNTLKEPVLLKEYGRNIQDIAEYVAKIEDKDKRTESAKLLVKLMSVINPNLKENLVESHQKLWDHLYIMTDFKLDAESPFPKPAEDILEKKPQIVPYSNNRIRYKHYGKNMERMIEHACTIQNPEDKKAAIAMIGKMMKNFYMTWNKEVISDEVILEQMVEISKGKLSADIKEIMETRMFDSEKSHKPFHNRTNNNPNNNNRNNNNRNKNKNFKNFKRNKF
jgi:hypothetical protein